MAHILVFGDSTAYGAWDREGGWVTRLRKYLDQDLLEKAGGYYLVYNLGVSGDNTHDILNRFENEVKSRLDTQEETIIVFAVGVNDTQFVISNNACRTSLSQFEENIKDLIIKAQLFSSKVVFVGLEMVDESRTTPIEWSEDKHYRNDLIEQYDQKLKEVCKEKQVYLIDIRNELKKLNYPELMEDGLHPNSAGHQKISEIIINYLKQQKII